MQGSVKFYCLTTGRVLKRRCFTPLVIPDRVIKRVNTKACMNNKATIFGSSIAARSHMNGLMRSPKMIRTSKASSKNLRPTRTYLLSFRECFSTTRISTYQWSRTTLNPTLLNWP